MWTSLSFWALAYPLRKGKAFQLLAGVSQFDPYTCASLFTNHKATEKPYGTMEGRQILERIPLFKTIENQHEDLWLWLEN